MNRMERTSYELLLMIGLLVFPGCAIIPLSSPPPTRVLSLGYEVQAPLDPKTIVGLLEESLTKVLKRPITVDETTSSLISANSATPVLLREKVVPLERLGNVAIPSIICPGALASMSTFLPGKAGLRLIAGCVVGNEAATLIYLVDAVTDESMLPGLSHDIPESLLLPQISTALIDRLPEARAIEAITIPVHRTWKPSVYAEGATSDDFALAKETATADHGDTSAHAFPVVCFSPKERSTAVREHPGSNMVIGMLGSDLIVQDEDPTRNSFLHVTTREGRFGWVKRSDVRWTPCPLA